MNKNIARLFLSAALAMPGLASAEPNSSEAQNMATTVQKAMGMVDSLKSKMSTNKAFKVAANVMIEGEMSVVYTINPSAAQETNSYDRNIVDNLLPRLEKLLASAASKFISAAENLPKASAYRIFYNGCGDAYKAQSAVSVAKGQAASSRQFNAGDFQEVDAELAAAIRDNKCQQ